MHLKSLVASCAVALLAGTGCTPVGSQQGYEPVQPIAYSHELHAGQLGLDCQYCHFAAEKSRHAGVPHSGVCMNCHMLVKNDQPEVMKLASYVYEKNEAIPWVKVHRLPDHVFFSHANHVTSGVKCQTCHGPVETMAKVRQVETMTMGWCIECHRKTNEEQRTVPFDAPKLAAADKKPQVVAVVASAGNVVLPAAPSAPATGPGRLLNPPTDC